MSTARQTFSAGELFRWQEAGCSLGSSPSPFYEAIFARCAKDCEGGDSPFIEILQIAPMTIESASPLRLMGALHRGVLSGEFPDLATSWPSTHKPSGDVGRAFEQIRALCSEPPQSVLDVMTRDPQTNEVGRSAGLALGLAMIHERCGLPIRLLEIGASAGLNLRIDRYVCETGDWRWGPAESPLHFDVSCYTGSVDATLSHSFRRRGTVENIIIDRRGCDISPIDPTSRDGGLSLMSYVWPDQFARLQRLRAAIAVAKEFPVVIDKVSADDWIDANVQPESGIATVVMHSVMWQYMPDAVQTRCEELLALRGRAASTQSPLYELSMEPTPGSIEMTFAIADLLTMDHQPYARSGGHGPPIEII